MTGTIGTGHVLRGGLVALLIVYLTEPRWFEPLLAPLTQFGASPIYDQTPILTLAINHLLIVAAATLAASILAITLAIIVTRPFGEDLLPLSRALANIGQTFPPVAVLAIAVPVFGFGSWPTLIALFLYALLPVFENALTGLSTIPREIKEAARAMGMTGWQRLVRVELPLALPVIFAGIRLAAVISLGTATIGSTVAAQTLGEVIIAGLVANNIAFVLQGGLVVAALAILVYDAFIVIERRLSTHGSIG